jgi:Nitrile hydratase beta subunit
MSSLFKSAKAGTFTPAKVPMASVPLRKNELRAGAAGRSVHDVGGLDFGPIDKGEHDLALWEKRVDAMLILMVGTKARAYTLDAHRRAIEDYNEQQFDATTYYEKWVRSIRNLMVEQDIATPAEIEARMADVARRMVADGRAVGPLTIAWETHHQGAPVASHTPKTKTKPPQKAAEGPLKKPVTKQKAKPKGTP